MTQTTMQKGTISLVEKMKASGRYHPISEEEYCRLKAEQTARLVELENARYVPDYSRMGLRSDEINMTWDLVKPNISDGLKAMNAVRPAYALGSGMVFLWGKWGQAKTLVGKILTATALRDGKRAAFANLSSVLDDIRLAFDEQEHKTTELLRRIDWWISRDVLFLDEIDKSNDTPWAQERLFQLLDQRYVRAIREEALTVIASNKSDGELDGYLRSRLNDRRVGPVVYLDGPDGRQVMPDGYHF
jgi:DNA replication protein DnaC